MINEMVKQTKNKCHQRWPYEKFLIGLCCSVHPSKRNQVAVACSQDHGAWFISGVSFGRINTMRVGTFWRSTYSSTWAVGANVWCTWCSTCAVGASVGYREVPLLYLHSLSGRIGQVVASNADGCKVARSNPGFGWAAPIYTKHEELKGYCPWGWGLRPVNWIYRLWRHCP